MRNKSFTFRFAVSLVTALAVAIPLLAQDTSDHHKRPRYKIELIPTLGGPGSFIGGGPPSLGLLSNDGTLIAQAYTTVPDPYFGWVIHDFRVRNGALRELGALPPADTNSGQWTGIGNGIIVGFSENAMIDPLTGFPENEAVLWRNGVITDLGNFGGNGSLAIAVNNRGQIVGAALNTIPDPYSGSQPFLVFPVAQQYRATLWESGVMRDLGTLGGTTAVAGLLNESGQVAGLSYTNTIPNATTGIPTLDSFFWERGRMVDIGNLGGTYGFPYQLNNRGQLVGVSSLPGDQTVHPYLWDRGHLKDLGTLGGTYGEAHGINDGGAVTGVANLPGDQLHDAFLWKNGVLIDLGTLGRTSTAYAINSSDQVVGASTVTPGTVHAFLWEQARGMIDLNDLIPPAQAFTCRRLTISTIVAKLWGTRYSTTAKCELSYSHRATTIIIRAIAKAMCLLRALATASLPPEL